MSAALNYTTFLGFPRPLCVCVCVCVFVFSCAANSCMWHIMCGYFFKLPLNSRCRSCQSSLRPRAINRSGATWKSGTKRVHSMDGHVLSPAPRLGEANGKRQYLQVLFRQQARQRTSANITRTCKRECKKEGGLPHTSESTALDNRSFSELLFLLRRFRCDLLQGEFVARSALPICMAKTHAGQPIMVVMTELSPKRESARGPDLVLAVCMAELRWKAYNHG